MLTARVSPAPSKTRFRSISTEVDEAVLRRRRCRRRRVMEWKYSLPRSHLTRRILPLDEGVGTFDDDDADKKRV